MQHNTRFQERYGVTISRAACDLLWERVETVLLSRSKMEARQLATQLAKEPYPLSFLYLEVMIPVLFKIHEEWNNRQRPFSDVTFAWSLAEWLRPLLSLRRLTGVRLDKPPVLVSVVDGNAHALGAQLLTDLLMEAHYPATNLAPPVTRATILKQSLALHPVCILLSVSMPEHLPELLATADALRRRGYAGRIAAGGSALPPRIPVDWPAHGIDWAAGDPLAFMAWLDEQLTAGEERRAA